MARSNAADLSRQVEGQYLLLLRIEASDDKEADSDLAVLGVGSGAVHAAGVAGFPMPVLRYVVGGRNAAANAGALEQLQPPDGAEVAASDAVDLVWAPGAAAAYYRVTIESNAVVIHQALVPAATGSYRVPPFVFDKVSGGSMRWPSAA